MKLRKMKLRKMFALVICSVLIITLIGVPYINTNAKENDEAAISKLEKYVRDNFEIVSDGQIETGGDAWYGYFLKKDYTSLRLDISRNPQTGEILNVDYSMTYNFDHYNKRWYRVVIQGDENSIDSVQFYNYIVNDSYAVTDHDFDMRKYNDSTTIENFTEMVFNGSGYVQGHLDLEKEHYAWLNESLHGCVDEWVAIMKAADVNPEDLGFDMYSATNSNIKENYTQMYRLYNPNSGEHFYTADGAERNNLVNVGWQYEGVAWNAPVTSDTPVYRLYNPNAGDHHYTTNATEKDYLVSVGWNYEGIGWYSTAEDGQPLYRLYNPNAIAGAHHYTTSAAERDYLVSVGWNDEGIAWYGGN